MNKRLPNMTGLILLIICFVVFLIAGHNTDNRNNARNRFLERNGLYTIGEVVEYGAHTITGSSQFIEITYKVKGIKYQVISGYYVPFENGPSKGERFVALYLPNEPEKCALLFDYPIKDSTDFERYLEDFKKNPPKLK